VDNSGDKISKIKSNNGLLLKSRMLQNGWMKFRKILDLNPARTPGMPKVNAQGAKEHKVRELNPYSSEKINENSPEIARIQIQIRAAGPSRIASSPSFLVASGVSGRGNGLRAGRDAEHVGNSAVGRNLFGKFTDSRLLLFSSPTNGRGRITEHCAQPATTATWRPANDFSSREFSPTISFSPGDC